jgi:hypothetical protein
VIHPILLILSIRIEHTPLLIIHYSKVNGQKRFPNRSLKPQQVLDYSERISHSLRKNHTNQQQQQQNLLLLISTDDHDTHRRRRSTATTFPHLRRTMLTCHQNYNGNRFRLYSLWLARRCCVSSSEDDEPTSRHTACSCIPVPTNRRRQVARPQHFCSDARGITWCITPLLSLLADQKAKINIKASRNDDSILAIHLDEFIVKPTLRRLVPQTCIVVGFRSNFFHRTSVVASVGLNERQRAPLPLPKRR